MLIQKVSPTGKFTTVIPLTFILFVSAIKEIVEDTKRKWSDHYLNNKITSCFYKSCTWQNVKWKNVKVGDILKIETNELFPCDLLFLSSSEENSTCSIETSNLDGETNLKIKQSAKETAKLKDSSSLSEFKAEIEYDLPNQHLYEFKGSLHIEKDDIKIPLRADHILLRGSQLRNTKWIYGVVIYSGMETKLMMNSASPPLKRSQIDRKTNKHIIILFLVLLLLSVFSSLLSYIWDSKEVLHWYIDKDTSSHSFVFKLFTFVILYNNLIPISLQVTLEMVRFLQAIFINWDDGMYDEANDFRAIARTSNLNEELGQIEYVFSDKTGTLTCNKMKLKHIFFNGISYKIDDETVMAQLNSLSDGHEVMEDFLILLATCHTVMPEKQNDKIVYHSASPDENALINGVKSIGAFFHTRKPNKIFIDLFGEERSFDILNILEFNSTRKRMSVILKDNKTGQIKLYCKGADNVILPRLNTTHSGDINKTINMIEEYARDGLRTLVLAYKILDDKTYQEWNKEFQLAENSIIDRDESIDKLSELIEQNLEILGATAIEDQLQDGVPETIQLLKKGGIKVWILTGDKMETAINIGYSSKLLNLGTNLIYLIDDDLVGVKKTIKKNIQIIGDIIENKSEEADYGLIIEGRALKYALLPECVSEFVNLALMCNMVICCRATPKNKSAIVECIKKSTNSITLSIGDGANDVAMIQAAHVGIGIYGLEGTQALAASDYGISQFRFLSRLLFVHGAWNHKRISKVIMYSYYKNICLYIIQFWYAAFNGFSGQNLFDRWLIGFYNVIFTAAPPMVLGLFDRSLSAETMLKFPELYKIQINKNEFSMKVFVKWIFNSFLHSLSIFFLSYGILSHETVLEDGTTGDYIFIGNFVYVFCVVVVCLKAGLESDCWTILTHISIWGSIVSWFIFLAVYCRLWPYFDIGNEIVLIDTNLYRGGMFWMCLIFVPITVIIPDLIYKAYTRTFRKTLAQKILEYEAELAKNTTFFMFRGAIKVSNQLLKSTNLVLSKLNMTRIVPKMPKTNYRGFAFSQEENGYVNQNDLLKNYDSTKKRPDGF